MSPTCVKIQPVTEIDKLLYEHCTNNMRPAFVEVGEDKVCMPVLYESIINRIDNFEVRDSDVFIISHPRAGTTWTQEMVWLIINDLNFEGAQQTLLDRSPYLELQSIVDFEKVQEKNPNAKIPSSVIDSINFTNYCKHNPRVIKTHLNWNLLPKQIRDNTKKPKIIYVARNPKDTCTSFYHHCKVIDGLTADFEIFQNLFMAGRVLRGPFWNNVLGYWNRKDQDNILFIKFEDMKADLRSVIKKVANFLNKNMDDKMIADLTDYLDFQKMKNNKNYQAKMTAEITGNNSDVNGNSDHLRQGIVGGYKTEMTPEMIKEFDDWTEKNLTGTGLSFKV